MIGVENVDRLDGQLTCRRIGEIIAEISAQVAGRNTKLAIALRLGRDTKLGTAVRRASLATISRYTISMLNFSS